jgi:hypothetical protein
MVWQPFEARDNRQRTGGYRFPYQVRPKAAVNAPHSMRFARLEAASQSRQRLECGGGPPCLTPAAKNFCVFCIFSRLDFFRETAHFAYLQAD